MAEVYECRGRLSLGLDGTARVWSIFLFLRNDTDILWISLARIIGI